MAVTRGPILVLAAHPDDEVLGCGGSLLKWKDAGHPIHVAFLGEGRPGGDQASVAVEAARLGGWDLIGWNAGGEFGPTPSDETFDTLGVLKVAQWMAHEIAAIRPFRFLTHSQHDMNQDHEILARAAKVVCQSYRAPTVREVLAFQIPGSVLPTFTPQYFLDTSEHWNRKAKLLECYAKELREFPHPRSIEGILHQESLYGSMAGYRMAEAFEVIQIRSGQTSGTAS